MDVLQRIDETVKSHRIVLFMKGTPQLPQCGYSSRTAQAMSSVGVEYAYVNVLTDREIFENLPRYRNWPTFPQIYINGELIGGHDICMELYQKGELQKMMRDAAGAEAGGSESGGG